MRDGWTPKLRNLLHRADPALRLIAEVVEVVASDIKDVKDEWAAADSTTGFQILLGAGARLSSSLVASVSLSTDDGTQTTELSEVPPTSAVLIDWEADGDEERELANLIARLDPRADGGQPKEAHEWMAQLFRVAERGPDTGRISVVPISKVVPVSATGETASDVTFDFRDEEGVPIVGPPPVDLDESGTETPARRPQTLVCIWAVNTEGTAAGNVAWMSDSSIGGTYDVIGHKVRHYRLVEADSVLGRERGGSVFTLLTVVNQMPRFTLNKATYAEATITFSGGGNKIDLGAAPTKDLEIVASGQTPSDSSITYEIWDGAAWVECFDGDIIGQDNRNLDETGSDLSNVPVQQTYSMQAKLTPSWAGFATPTVRRLGVREIDKTDLSGIATVNGAVWQVDPRTLKGNITRANIHILKTGERDYRDYGSELLAQRHIGEFEVRVWVGDLTGVYLNRSEWLHIDSFEVEDYKNTDTAHVVIGVSPLRRLRRKVPKFVVTSGRDGERKPVEYLNQTIKAAAADIIDNLIGLPGRFRGPEIEDTAVVSKTIREADAKNEIDRLAYLAGCGVISSQGRVKAVRMMRDDLGSATPVATFFPGDYTPIDIGPGYAKRVDEFFVPFGWNETAESFEGESRYVNATAFTKLGGHGLQATDRLEEETAKWIPGETLGNLVAKRVPHHFGNGLILWKIRSTYANPHLEPGDPAVVVTQQFVARSPISDREIRGTVAALGIVSRAGDLWGHELDVWIPAFDKIVVLDGDVTRLNYKKPDTLECEVVFSAAGVATARFRCNADTGSIKAMGDASAFQGKSTVRAQSAQATDADGYVEVTLPGTYVVGATCFVTALAYETATATGSEEVDLYKQKFLRVEGAGVDCAPVLDEDDGTYNLHPYRTSAAQSIRYFKTTNGTDPTLAEVQGGTVSTADEVAAVHTSPTEGQRVKVGVLAYENNDGTGVEGPLHIVRDTYRSEGKRPTVTWMRFTPTDATKEGVRFVARDDGATVNFGYVVQDEGGGDPTWPGGFTTTGLVADPTTVAVEVAKPAEGATNQEVIFQAVDADGNLAFVKPQRVTIDGDAIPTGAMVGETDILGATSVAITSIDSDTGSWRLKAAVDAYADPTGAVDGSEFSGATFPTDQALGASWQNEAVYVTGYFYRTTATDWATQNASAKSEKIRFIIPANTNYVEVTGKNARNVAPSGGNQIWEIVFDLFSGEGCQSIRVQFTHELWNKTADRPPNFVGSVYNYTVNVTGPTETSHALGDGNPSIAQFRAQDDAGTTLYDIGGLVTFTPYSKPNGTGVAGTPVTVESPLLADWQFVGVVMEAGGQDLPADKLAVGSSLTVTRNADGRPELDVKVSDFSTAGTGAPGGTPVDGAIYTRHL